MPVVRTFVLSIAVAAALVAPAAYSQHRVGRPAGGGAFMEWEVAIQGHERIELTVLTPDGVTYAREFNAGRNPSIRLEDLGPELADGAYNYQLRVVPKISADTKKKLQKARAANDEASIRKIARETGLTQTVVQSGTFTILNGSIVSPDGVEPDANDGSASANGVGRGAGVASTASRNWQVGALDQVIPDDLIVQASTCTGFDCVDGESFGFDTLRLKENNLRIHFEDTSTSAGYPANDWRIVANDSGSGGANKFVVEDSTAARNPFTIEADAPANAIYVDSTGNIGFQQSAPGLDLHLTTSDTPALRLDQTNSGGFTAQTWDIGANEANFFIRDLTGGSKLSFRIRPGAPTSSIDIAASGYVGVGTASPKAKFHVIGPSTVTTFPTPIATADLFVLENGDHTNLSLVSGTGKQATLRFFRNGATSLNGFMRYDHSNDSMLFGVAGSTRVTITSSAVGIGNTAPTQPLMVGTTGSGSGGNGAHVTAGGTWTNGSSRGFKQDIEELDAGEAMQAVAALKPVRYHYKAEPDEEYVGFIAEDVPELVAQTSTDRKYLSPMDIVAALTKVVQEQQKTVEAQQKTIEELAAKVEQLQKQQ
jgi:hypothetical protein